MKKRNFLDMWREFLLNSKLTYSKEQIQQQSIFISKMVFVSDVFFADNFLGDQAIKSIMMH